MCVKESLGETFLLRTQNICFYRYCLEYTDRQMKCYSKILYFRGFSIVNVISGTIGLALGACSVPGSSAPLFKLQADEMELGLGEFAITNRDII